MKKLFVLILLLCLIQSCASSKKQEHRDAISEMVQSDRYVDEAENLPDLSRFKIGMHGNRLYARGEAELSIKNSRSTVERAAIMDGETKLLSEAPSDFRILTQNALTSAGVDANEFYQIQTKIQTVVGLTGINYDARKTMCKKLIKNDGYDTSVSRTCWIQVHIPLSELVKAYRRTLALKFGQSVGDEFKKKMDNELKKLDTFAPKSQIKEKKHENNISSNVVSKQDIAVNNIKPTGKNSSSAKLLSKSRK